MRTWVLNDLISFISSLGMVVTLINCDAEKSILGCQFFIPLNIVLSHAENSDSNQLALIYEARQFVDEEYTFEESEKLRNTSNFVHSIQFIIIIIEGIRAKNVSLINFGYF